MSNFSPNLNKDELKLIRGLEALAQMDEGAPAEVRARLGLEFRRKTRHPVRWLAVAAAVSVLLLSRPTPPRKSTAPSRPPDLSSFIPLDSEPVSAGVVVRVKLPRAALFDDGGPGVVEAEVLLGDDGLAHAVRLIK